MFLLLDGVFLPYPTEFVGGLDAVHGRERDLGRYSDGGFAGRLGFREPDRGRGGGELIRGGGGGGGGENMW